MSEFRRYGKAILKGGVSTMALLAAAFGPALGPVAQGVLVAIAGYVGGTGLKDAWKSRNTAVSTWKPLAGGAAGSLLLTAAFATGAAMNGGRTVQQASTLQPQVQFAAAAPPPAPFVQQAPAAAQTSAPTKRKGGPRLGDLPR
jgi:hypothetical protein